MLYPDFPDAARRAIAAGDPALFLQLTGTPYRVSGTVVKGNQLGRTLGFPTANILPDPETPFIAAHGVYAVRAETGGKTYKAVANAGIRPTIGGTALTLEAHLLDFSEDIYDQSITLYFVAHIRGEQKFANLGALKEQILRDILAAEALLA